MTTPIVTINEANEYFAGRLHVDTWLQANVLDKNKALITATRYLNKFDYFGTKTLETQEHEFPRSGSTEIPNEIKMACYEIAISLLDGSEIDRDVDNLSITGQGFSGARATYDRAFALEHIRAGVPNPLAWDYIKPFLRDSNAVKLRRV